MKKSKRIFLFVILLMTLMLPTAAFAKGLEMPLLSDKVILGGTYTLYTGEELHGNLVVIGGVVDLEEDSRVIGDVVVIGGNVTIAGEVSNNLVAIGGVVNLRDTAMIQGDLVAPSSTLQKEEGAEIRGQVITSSGPIEIEGVDVPEIPEMPEIDEWDQNFYYSEPEFRINRRLNPALDSLWKMFQIFSVSAVAVVVILFVPTQARRTSNAIVSQPLISGLMGLLTFVVALILMALLAITIILIPVSFLLGLALGIGLFFGWIAIGHELGRRIGQ